MALLSDTDPDPTPRSTLCCDSAVGAYKHSDPEKKAKKERRELKTERGGRDFMYTFNIKQRSKRGNKSIQVSFFLHPLLSAEPDLNPATNGA